MTADTAAVARGNQAYPRTSAQVVLAYPNQEPGLGGYGLWFEGTPALSQNKQEQKKKINIMFINQYTKGSV